jgi:translation elongation factor EF-Ts
MMECKAALDEADGDFARAKEILREKGKAAAAKRADRTTGAGVSRHQMYLQPSAAMVAHVRQFSGQAALGHNFSGDR